MEMKILTTPFVAYDYLTKGDDSKLTPEQKKAADEWAKDWEISSPIEYFENDTLSPKIVETLLDTMT